MNEQEQRLLREAASFKIQLDALSASLDAFLTELTDLAESRAQHEEEKGSR